MITLLKALGTLFILSVATLVGGIWFEVLREVNAEWYVVVFLIGVIVSLCGIAIIALWGE